MSMQVGGKKGGVMADINVTPMADIMIVLLIIFMVITPMLQKGVDVKLPSASNTAERDDQKTLEVALKQDTTLFFKGLKLDRHEDLVPRIKEALEDRADTERVVYLKADIELPYEEVMKIMDLCRDAGVEEVALIAEQKVQGGA